MIMPIIAKHVIKMKKGKKKNDPIILFNIDFITKIKIKEEEEWI
jgi:hypothetical protein